MNEKRVVQPRKTHEIDATGIAVGRLATRIATILRGKHKATYVPYKDEGDSVNVDGVCSTINHLGDSSFSVYYMPETLSKTTMGNLNTDHLFNLEHSLSLKSLIGGHLVSGHIDTIATLLSIKPEQESKVLTFKTLPEFTKYIIYKGSIAINGVSLTIVTVNKESFSVSLIPYTLEHTNLGTLNIGDKVNIEVDLMAKYLEKFITPYLKNK